MTRDGEALASSARQGFVYYEWRKDYKRIELDFAVWIENLGRFARQVEGGRYLLVNGELAPEDPRRSPVRHALPYLYCASSDIFDE